MKKTKNIIILIILVFTLSMMGSGCNLGFGVKLDTSIAKMFFDSTQPEISGEVYLDSIHIGYLDPLGRVSSFAALDFDHEVRVENIATGKIYRWVFQAPFHAAEIIPLEMKDIIPESGGDEE
ncbi:MAG: hypothetical protein WCP87_01930 [Atribacterota bacterium]